MPKPRASLIPWLAAPAVLLIAAGLRAAPPKPAEVSDPEITAAEVRAHVRYLASEELQGRGSGTAGNDRAAEYLAARFRAAGLKPAGDGSSYFQKFPVFTGSRLGDANELTITDGRGSSRLRVGDDFMPLVFTGNGRAEAPLVFAGYGISRPELGYDDYKELDVRGKVVLVLRHTPDGEDNGKYGNDAVLTKKTMTAREKGAAGILLLTGPLTERAEDLGFDPEKNRGADPRERFREAYRRNSASSDCGIPAAFVKRDFVERLLAPMGKSLQDFQVAAAHGKADSFLIPGARLSLRTDVVRQIGQTRNVLGLVEGTDPQLKREVVVVGAHYDHLGLGDDHSLADSTKPEIHHGADDNASGTAGVIELAQYFARHRAKLGRSVLFMGFSGEEMGLLGSAYWVKKPTIPLERIAAMINLDMIGRMKGDSFSIIGAGTSPAWPELLGGLEKQFALQPKSGGSGGFGASDQQSFYARGIPVLFFFTGVHADYHRPSDTWEKVNAEGEAKLLRFVSGTVERVSRLKERPRFAKSREQEPAAGPGFRVYLGTIPDYAEEGEGVTLQGVRPGSPAEKAGILAGDVLVEFDGKKIRNVQEYTVVLAGAKPNVAVPVVVLRKKERVMLTITPAERKG